MTWVYVGGKYVITFFCHYDIVSSQHYRYGTELLILTAYHNVLNIGMVSINGPFPRKVTYMFVQKI